VAEAGQLEEGGGVQPVPSPPHQWEPLDLVSLAEMRFAVFPKLYLPSGEAVNLFDNLVKVGEGGEEEATVTAMGNSFLLPRGSAFLMSDITRLRPLLSEATSSGGHHLLVLDPPWENASAKRRRSYQTLPPRRLLQLPVPQLLAPEAEGPLVALWMTNRPRLWRFVDEELLPHWRLQKVATWYWLKVTDHGDPVTALDSLHRFPYEPLILARRMEPEDEAAPPAGRQHSEHRSCCPGTSPPPSMRVFVSPPGCHSRKPRLGALLSDFLGAPAGGHGPRLLEMFARELEAGWTSWGNEVLKFQDRRFFAPGPCGK